MRRDAFVIEGLVSEERTKEKASKHFKESGDRTRIHFHSADDECNDRCVWWPSSK